MLGPGRSYPSFSDLIGKGTSIYQESRYPKTPLAKVPNENKAVRTSSEQVEIFHLLGSRYSDFRNAGVPETNRNAQPRKTTNGNMYIRG